MQVADGHEKHFKFPRWRQCQHAILSCIFTWTCLHQSPLPPSQSNFCLQMFWATLMPKNLTLRQKLFNRKSFPRLNSTLAERNLNHLMKRSRRIMNNSAIDLKRIQPWQKAKFDMPFLALGIFESWCYSRRGIISPSQVSPPSPNILSCCLTVPGILWFSLVEGATQEDSSNFLKALNKVMEN